MGNGQDRVSELTEKEPLTSGELRKRIVLANEHKIPIEAPLFKMAVQHAAAETACEVVPVMDENGKYVEDAVAIRISGLACDESSVAEKLRKNGFKEIKDRWGPARYERSAGGGGEKAEVWLDAQDTKIWIPNGSIGSMEDAVKFLNSLGIKLLFKASVNEVIKIQNSAEYKHFFDLKFVGQQMRRLNDDSNGSVEYGYIRQFEQQIFGIGGPEFGQDLYDHGLLRGEAAKKLAVLLGVDVGILSFGMMSFLRNELPEGEPKGYVTFDNMNQLAQGAEGVRLKHQYFSHELMGRESARLESESMGYKFVPNEARCFYLLTIDGFKIVTDEAGGKLIDDDLRVEAKKHLYGSEIVVDEALFSRCVELVQHSEDLIRDVQKLKEIGMTNGDIEFYINFFRQSHVGDRRSINRRIDLAKNYDIGDSTVYEKYVELMKKARGE